MASLRQELQESKQVGKGRRWGGFGRTGGGESRPTHCRGG
jgi:hypothetical protein